MRLAHYLLAAVLLCACPVAARATQRVKLHATLTPNRLGQPTTIGFAFEIASPVGQVPPPLAQIDIRYPNNLGIAISGLGLAVCFQQRLEEAGLDACPANSLMGSGSALAEIPIGPAILKETAAITLVRAPTQDGHLTLLISVNGQNPVDAQLAFPALLLPAPSPFGGRLQISVPLIPSLPGGPPVAVVRLRTTLGPQGLTYYEHNHGKTVAYHPEGILLPRTCPHNGFPFAADFTFLDGSDATAHTLVACPQTRGGGGPARSNALSSH